VTYSGNMEEGLLKRVPGRWVVFGVDACVWLTAVPFAAVLRYESAVFDVDRGVLIGLTLAAVFLQWFIGGALGLYRPGVQTRMGGFENALNVATAAACGGLSLWGATLVFGGSWQISRGMMLIATLLAIIMMLSIRYAVRLAVQRSRRPGAGAASTIVLGGGHIGTHLIRWMMSDPYSLYLPVAVLDDNPELWHGKISGVPVLGPLRTIKNVAQQTQSEVLIVAIAEPDPSFLRYVQDLAVQSGLAVKLMPPIGDVVSEGIRGRDLRDLSIEDLLGRDPVDTNVAEIAQYLRGRRVMVTGAGGSIGSQLCTEIAKFAPAELIMLDRDETGLQQALINVSGNGLLDTDEVVLADIRDAQEIMDIFHRRRPEVVFHAAALKHLPMLEQYPDEAWKTNVLGTLNVLRAAEAAGVETFINVSTDKAANPTSVLGHSKLLAEVLTGWFARSTGQRFLSVRFGNVIGSRGSMLPTFVRLIQEDKPLTITHPQATRYFMTIPEACQLVLQAGGIGSEGEVLILDMGEPVSIMDVAQRMIAMSGKDIDIVVTGLRPGEKLHEELAGHGEELTRPLHPKISHTQAGVLPPDELSLVEFHANIRGGVEHESA